MQVLIETYWNVKEHCERITGCTEFVLIETYWNVKDEAELIPPVRDKY